uniref:Hexosyltransferase n=1 Tax=Periophthalmus magnuspinnatus TaxID=409849 RepID=A0A3B4AIT6_9GOBI
QHFPKTAKKKLCYCDRATLGLFVIVAHLTLFFCLSPPQWRPFLPGLKYEVIDSAYISLYTDESTLKMNSVEHIPQTLASHIHLPEQSAPPSSQHGADMLKPDPRDTFYSIPMIDPARLENVLPACLYSPTYVVKDFPIARYQGLQFVYLSFVYPNDFTRLTHMERENKCFYRESPIYLERFGFYKYMKMDEEEDDRPFFFPNPDDFLEEEEVVDTEDEAEIVGTPPPKKPSQTSHTANPEHSRRDEDALNRIMQRRGRRHFVDRDREWVRGNMGKVPSEIQRGAFQSDAYSVVRGRSLSWIRTGPEEPEGDKDPDSPPKLNKNSLLFPQKSHLSVLANRAKQILTNSAHSNNLHDNKKKEETKIYITRPRPAKERERERRERREEREKASRHPREVFPGVFLYQNGKTTKLVNVGAKGHTTGGRNYVSPPLWPPLKDKTGPQNGSIQNGSVHKSVVEKQIEKMKRKGDYHGIKKTVTPLPPLNTTHNAQIQPDVEPEPEEGELSDYSYEEVEPRPGWAEESINWQRTFSVNPMDFELLRSDWNDLRCNVSGNLQLAESEVVDVLAQYMEKLNERNGGIYTLLRIINVEKRRDSARGNRYLVELELMERGRSVVRLSEYIYLLLHRSRQGDESPENTDSILASAPAAAPSAAAAPGHVTQPPICLCICFDRYEYLRREGNFERSAGLQIGVDTIEDSHSIVFLCDLHIHFPMNILESIRKHCVEGRLAFAPIVMRLSCGSSPHEPDGYWEVNGFGLFGIYKSDFDKIGGMNTEEFKDRWGGEDWELLDRVLQNGLEVERLRLRNFFHYYHSKRGMWNAQNKKSPKG